MRVVIVDDERLAVIRMQQILESREDVEIAGVFTKPSELLKEYPRLLPDVVFLDIDMPGMNGLELAASLLELDEKVEIVFVTAYDQYALEAFRVNALDYLLKPVDELSFSDTMKRLSRRIGGSDPRPKEAAPLIRCFGHYAVPRASDQKPVDFPTAKAEELLAFFLIHRETNVSKWLICESLWPEHEPGKAEQNLHTTVFRMKKTLLENGIRIHLSAKKGYYYFQLQDDCDYIQFEELSKDNTAALADSPAETEKILRLFKGPLFGYKDYAWSEGAREQAYQSFREMSKALARSYMKAGEYQLAHDFLQFMLTIAPYDEDAHEMILRIYLHRKDRSSFLRHYHKMQETLQKEMGVDQPGFMEPLLRKMMNEI